MITRTWLPWRYLVEWSITWTQPVDGGWGSTEHGSLGKYIVWGRRRAERRLAVALLRIRAQQRNDWFG